MTHTKRYWSCPRCHARKRTRRGTYIKLWRDRYLVVENAVWERCSSCRLDILGAGLLKVLEMKMNEPE